MTRYESILVATDFSPAATHAVRRAALLAEQHEAQLRLLHVVSAAGSAPLRRLFAAPIDLELRTVQTRASLRRFAREIIGRHGVAATFDVVVGDTFEAIHRACEHADVIVLGQHGASSLKERVIGGTAERLLRTCRKPVLVVKRAAEDRPYRRVLVPVDLTGPAEAALGLAGALATQAAIHVFHADGAHRAYAMRIADAPASAIRSIREIDDARTRARMHELATRSGIEPWRVSAAVGRGDALPATLEQEQRLQADLIVAGRQGRSTMADFLLGSVTRRLLTHSACDVMVVPRPPADASAGRHAADVDALAAGAASARRGAAAARLEMNPGPRRPT